MPKPGTTIGRGERLHFRAKRGDLDGQVLVTDRDGAWHQIILCESRLRTTIDGDNAHGQPWVSFGMARG